MGIGQELVTMLRGDEVLNVEADKKQQPPSKQVEQLLARAEEMVSQGKFWHHHMFFSGCRFNKYKGKYAIIFEDQENQSVIESVTNEEPKGDLQYIEALFYNQKSEKIFATET